MYTPAYKLMASRFQETNGNPHSNELFSPDFMSTFFGKQLFFFKKRDKVTGGIGKFILDYEIGKL